jgi:hypothetical protein
MLQRHLQCGWRGARNLRVSSVGIDELQWSGRHGLFELRHLL